MAWKLLIADDEDIIRRGVKRYIESHSEKFDPILEASNGDETLDIITRERPDVILLDVQMPGKTGIEVMEAVRSTDLDPVIVILSGYDDFKYAQQAMRYGAKDYLLKPVRAQDILNSLEALAIENYGERKDVGLQNEELQDNRLVNAAIRYIDKHYSEPLSLQLVADQIGISRGYLSTRFTQAMDMGFVDYLNQVRIEAACLYLQQNSLKNYEIAYKVGFNDDKYFSRVFRKLKGMSPKEYRAKERNK